MDENELNALLGQLLQDLGGAFSVPLVQIGERLGLYEMLTDAGPCTAQELAQKADVNERYLREWLSAQAASKYIGYDPESDTFFMTAEQSYVFADRSSPVYMAPGFSAAAAFAQNEPLVREAFKTGQGIPWGSQTTCLACAVAQFFRPGYENHLLQAWLPALEGGLEKLQSGANVADIGCGHGLTTTMMAKGFPNSQFLGVDFHEPSIEAAREHAAPLALGNLKFDISSANAVSGGFDLVTIFDCLHDMGDPVAAMRHVKEMLGAEGVCMIVEPMAGDSLAENLNPVGRLYYSGSTMVCVPTSLAQETGAALGAQAGEKRLRQLIVEEAGFSSLRRIAETPFNMVLEAKP
ncbi:bifunctional 3-demethylubiquinone-9 3-methyltransferase/ 2-octaprenyl-6-hydroxy phenol methylase [Stieleria bergensis]|uniref:Bifunctional 3-demethylubiquinone-9 3-methyltransferase/ 2-octaprenyl-6-hydroxy phenol methylase n=1 Tax=Stieleria bergensis TaxID=2528025 RepID=A0A517SYH6_9BACT|nr:bifunctional 3-demethylubiquinone-9 3-methyltransferase/ 2-octaprenyl-6-hydroxy phenol methylase [Planctomycetes bacterium SV_7m_r]